MDGPPRVLSDPFAGRYTIGRELGRGGTATVHLAQDNQEHRQVAIKVLRPELSESIGATRFLREIRLTAKLHHPHILRVLDSGDEHGQLYLVLPFMKHGTLKQRMARDRQLSLSAAVGIARTVADALNHAHEQGFVHRDVKPDNILFSDDDVCLADFGIARAIEHSIEDPTTSTGIVRGTPAYMSPEQATGEHNYDGRSDVYSLACVLYEMLAGMPAFMGPTVMSLMAQRLLHPPRPIEVYRPNVPPALESAIRRALEVNPSDRFATAAEFSEALASAVADDDRATRVRSTAAAVDGIGGGSPRMAGVFGSLPRHGDATVAKRRARLLRLSFFLVAAIVLLAIAVTVARNRVSPLGAPNQVGHEARVTSRPQSLVPYRVAVLPFCMAGDSTPSPLGLAVVNVISSAISVGASLQPLDARDVLERWRESHTGCATDQLEDAAAFANRLGASSVITGRIVGRGSHLLLEASIMRRIASNWKSTGLTVEGPADRSGALVTLLASQLSGSLLGEDPQRLSQFAGRSPTAIKFYLSGRAFYREGQYPAALNHFWQALDADSTFALSALGIAEAGGWVWTTGSERQRRGLFTTWALRNQLSRRDRAVFEALVGRPDRFRSAREEYVDWEVATERAPDSPTAWYEFGDRIYHAGAILGVSNRWEKARSAFERSLQIDSAFHPPVTHLAQLAIARSDWVELEELQKRLFTSGADTDVLPFIQWRIAAARGRAGELDALRKSFREVSPRALIRIAGYSQIDAVDLTSGQAAADELLRRAVTSDEQVSALLALHDMAMNRASYDEASRLVARIDAIGPIRPGIAWNVIDSDALWITDAVIGGGDTLAAAKAAEKIARRTAVPAVTGVERYREVGDLCALGLWRARHGRASGLQEIIRRLRDAQTLVDSLEFFGATSSLCARMLEAQSAVFSGHPKARQTVEQLDSLARIAPAEFGAGFVNVVLAGLWSNVGDNHAALTASRRTLYDWTTGARYFIAHVREEGRVATLAGDIAGAANARRIMVALSGK